MNRLLKQSAAAQWAEIRRRRAGLPTASYEDTAQGERVHAIMHGRGVNQATDPDDRYVVCHMLGLPETATDEQVNGSIQHMLDVYGGLS